MKANKKFRTFVAVESVTFGKRITKWLDFDLLPKGINEDYEKVKHYLLDNFLLESKRPCGVLLNENTSLMIKDNFTIEDVLALINK